MEIDNIFRSATLPRRFLGIDSRIRFWHFFVLILAIIIGSGKELILPFIYLLVFLIYLSPSTKSIIRVTIIAIILFILYQLPSLISEKRIDSDSFIKGIRFGLILYSSFLLVQSISPDEISDTIYYLFKWIPGSLASRLAFMGGLTLSFIPLIIDSFSENNMAGTSRCLDSNKNLSKKIYYATSPVLGKIFKKSQEKADALESRCLDSDARFRMPAFKLKEIVWLIPVSTCLILMIFSKIFGF